MIREKASGRFPSRLWEDFLKGGAGGITVFPPSSLIVNSVDRAFVDTSQAKHTAGSKDDGSLLQRNVVGRALPDTLPALDAGICHPKGAAVGHKTVEAPVYRPG